jgi:hypothetical protein
MGFVGSAQGWDEDGIGEPQGTGKAKGPNPTPESETGPVSLALGRHRLQRKELASSLGERAGHS